MTRWATRLALALATLWAGSAQLAPAPAHADLTIGIVPSLIELRATPGGQGSQQLLVQNQGSEPFEVAATIEPYKQVTDDRSAVDWLSVDPPAFRLAPGEQQAVTVNIAVPPGLQSGGRYAMAAFKTGGVPAGGGTAVAGQLGVPFLIAVDGGGALTRRAALERILPVLEADGRVGFHALVDNGGNLHVFSRGGAVEVRRADGTPAGRLDLPQSTAVLPRSDELLEATGSLPLDEGAICHARATLEYGGDAPAVAELTFTARAALDVANLSAREIRDRGPLIQLGLRNDGELGLLPRIQLGLRDAEGKLLGTTAPPRPPLVWPGQTAEIETQFPRQLSGGEHVVMARVEYGAGRTIEREAGFRVGAPLPAADPAWGEAPARGPEAGPATAGVWWTVLMALVVLLMLSAGVAWLPSLAPFRRRLGRAASALRSDA